MAGLGIRTGTEGSDFGQGRLDKGWRGGYQTGLREWELCAGVAGSDGGIRIQKGMECPTSHGNTDS